MRARYGVALTFQEGLGRLEARGERPPGIQGEREYGAAPVGAVPDSHLGVPVAGFDAGVTVGRSRGAPRGDHEAFVAGAAAGRAPGTAVHGTSSAHVSHAPPEVTLTPSVPSHLLTTQ